MDIRDGIALAVFIGGWFAYNWLTDKSPWSRRGLSQAMNVQRRRWMQVMLSRDLRMIDTAIMAGLQQGTAFFASTCIFAIGGCFALLGSGAQIATIAADLPFHGQVERGLIEIKLLGEVTIFAYAFFKFGWAYRLFNYCTILIGAVPMRSDATIDPEAAQRAVFRAARMNQLAARNFNAGLRGVFFAIAFLGWFIGPYFLIGTTLFVMAILAHRQFFSPARFAVADDDEVFLPCPPPQKQPTQPTSLTESSP
ncbi:membrane protein [Aureimonas sp. SA4125]|nr:membrane protein [Aureimonas sp. SA4125]